MSKEYFSHDYNSRNKKKISALIHDFKMKGYGLFWVIAEMLHEDSANWMELDDFSYKSIAKESGCSTDYVKDFIDKCVSQYQVFIKDGTRFTTARVLVNMDKRNEIKEARSRAGKASAAAKQNATHVEQITTCVEHNPTKKIKLNEIKEVVVEGGDLWFEIFRRAAGAHINNDELILEIGKFQNKYPNMHPNAAGALVNTWISNIGRTQKNQGGIIV